VVGSLMSLAQSGVNGVPVSKGEAQAELIEADK
jgi:hypothetical protein